MIDKTLTNLPYRPCVGIVLFNNNNQVFIARRNDVGRQSWQFPQGGIDEGETPEVALYRELYEETGLKKEKVEVNVDVLKRNQRVDQDLKHLQKNRLVVKFLLTVVKATKMKRES